MSFVPVDNYTAESGTETGIDKIGTEPKGNLCRHVAAQFYRS